MPGTERDRLFDMYGRILGSIRCRIDSGCRRIRRPLFAASRLSSRVSIEELRRRPAVDIRPGYIRSRRRVRKNIGHKSSARNRQKPGPKRQPTRQPVFLGRERPPDVTPSAALRRRQLSDAALGNRRGPTKCMPLVPRARCVWSESCRFEPNSPLAAPLADQLTSASHERATEPLKTERTHGVTRRS